MARKSTDASRAARRRWYAANSAHAKAAIKSRRREMMEWLASLKVGKTCLRCPEGHPACLDYHHRDGAQKDLTISRVTRNGWSKERILQEIEKCDLLCSNCHRKEHWDEPEQVAA